MDVKTLRLPEPPIALRKKAVGGINENNQVIKKKIVITDEWQHFASVFRRFPKLEHEIMLTALFATDLCVECNDITDRTTPHPKHCMRRDLITKNVDRHCLLLMKLIANKISGYKQQDLTKKRFSGECFISKDEVLRLLFHSQLKCYYCKNPTKLFHEEIYDPKQFSLDRIDNNQGHNAGNLLIACLKCNLHRCRQIAEKFKFSKQLIVKKLA